MTVLIEEETEVIFPFDYKKLAEEIVETVIEAENFPYEAEVSLLLVSIETIQEINREYRKIDSATDVLSFPMVNYEFPGDFSKLEEQEDNFNPDTGEALLGDIVLCVDKVKEQATNFGHSEKREYAFLIMHSMLHLFGYDHMTKEEAVVMDHSFGDTGKSRGRKAEKNPESNGDFKIKIKFGGIKYEETYGLLIVNSMCFKFGCWLWKKK